MIENAEKGTTEEGLTEGDSGGGWDMEKWQMGGKGTHWNQFKDKGKIIVFNKQTNPFPFNVFTFQPFKIFCIPFPAAQIKDACLFLCCPLCYCFCAPVPNLNATVETAPTHLQSQ